MKTALCGLALTGLTTFAGPLQRGDIPADPEWVLHMDCDALRPTAVGQFLLAEMTKPKADNKLAAFQAIASFDPRTSLHGLSLFSTGPRPEESILIVYATFDAGRLTSLARGAKDYQSTTYRTHTVHHWIDYKKPAKDGVQPRTYAAIHGNRIIFGQQEARVSKALDVIDRVTGSLATNPRIFPNLGAVAQTSPIMQAAGRKLDMAAGDPNGAIFRMAQNVSLEVTETSGQVGATMEMQASDAEIAGHLHGIIQGVVSLMRLQQENPARVILAQSMSLTLDGSRVIGSFSMPAQTLIDTARAEAARKAAR